MTTAATIHPLRLATPLALFFALFFAIPLVLQLGVSLQGGDGGALGLTQYARFFADGLGGRVLFRTLLIGLETTLGCLLLGYPLALMYRNAPGNFAASAPSSFLRSVALYVPLIFPDAISTNSGRPWWQGTFSGSLFP